MTWGVLIGVTWTSLGTVLEVGMESWRSSQGLSDVHSQKRAGVLVVHAQEGLGEVSEEGLAGAGVGAQIRQQPRWGSPCTRACCVLGQKGVARGISALEF